MKNKTLNTGWKFVFFFNYINGEEQQMLHYEADAHIGIIRDIKCENIDVISLTLIQNNH